jgi:hypothetical protein
MLNNILDCVSFSIIISRIFSSKIFWIVVRFSIIFSIMFDSKGLDLDYFWLKKYFGLCLIFNNIFKMADSNMFDNIMIEFV